MFVSLLNHHFEMVISPFKFNSIRLLEDSGNVDPITYSLGRFRQLTLIQSAERLDVSDLVDVISLNSMG